MSLLGPVVLVPLISFIYPDNFDWAILKDIKTDPADAPIPSTLETTTERIAREEVQGHADLEDAKLVRARNMALIASVVMTFAYLLLWPIPMYGSKYIFSLPFFRGWVVVLFIWAFYGALVVVILPIWQGRGSMMEVFRFATGKSGKSGKETGVIESVDVSPPPEKVQVLDGEKGKADASAETVY